MPLLVRLLGIHQSCEIEGSDHLFLFCRWICCSSFRLTWPYTNLSAVWLFRAAAVDPLLFFCMAVVFDPVATARQFQKAQHVRVQRSRSNVNVQISYSMCQSRRNLGNCSLYSIAVFLADHSVQVRSKVYRWFLSPYDCQSPAAIFPACSRFLSLYRPDCFVHLPFAHICVVSCRGPMSCHPSILDRLVSESSRYASRRGNVSIDVPDNKCMKFRTKWLLHWHVFNVLSGAICHSVDRQASQSSCQQYCTSRQHSSVRCAVLPVGQFVHVVSEYKRVWVQHHTRRCWTACGKPSSTAA